MKFSELLEDVCLRIKLTDPSIKYNIDVLPNLNIKPQEDMESSQETKEDLQGSIQKILIWLGDLSRYQCDLEISKSVITAERFYRQVN